MKTSMILLATILLLTTSSNAQTIFRANLPADTDPVVGFTQNINPTDTDPVVTAASLADRKDDIIVRQMAYPVPTFDFLTVELQGRHTTHVRLRVEDTSGDEIYDLFKIVDLDPDYVGRIDMRNLDRAVYYLIVETADGEEITRMEIEKR